jgi:hypothetical protein
MHRYDIKNPNGSVVFVRGVRVKPYAKFSANLDPMTARELARYGVSLKQAASEAAAVPAPMPAAPVAEVSSSEETLKPVPAVEPEAAPIVEPAVAEVVPAPEAPASEAAEAVVEAAPAVAEATEEAAPAVEPEATPAEEASAETEEAASAETEEAASAEESSGDEGGRRKKKNKR